MFAQSLSAFFENLAPFLSLFASKLKTSRSFGKKNKETIIQRRKMNEKEK